MAIDIQDLRGPALTDDARRRLCWAYYERVYKAAFPVADEAEDPTVWLPLLTGTPPAPKPILHVLLAFDDNSDTDATGARPPLGGTNIEYFRRTRAALVTYLCVDPERRRQGVASLLLNRAADAARHDAGGLDIPIFAESEDPDDQPTPAARDAARARRVILSRLGFRRLPIHYRQPPLGPDKQALDTLDFLLWAPGGTPGIARATLAAFMREFYASLSAGTPDEARMFAGLDDETVPSLPLVNPT